LSRNQEVIGMAMMKTPFRYSDHVIDYIEFLLRHLGIEKEQIGCIAVASGPGSFTGLRIGLAIAKGLAQPLDLPAVGISTLEALAFRFRYVSDRIAPMIDARRQQIYGAVYRIADQEVEAVSEGVVMDPAEWLKGLGGTGDSRLRSSSYGAPRERSQNSEFRSQESAAFALQATARQGKEVRSLVSGKSPEDGLKEDLGIGNCVFVGDGAEMYRAAITARYPQARIISSDNRILEELCRLGHRRFIRGEARSAFELKANYIRPSDAKTKDQV